ncbi:hypothetical protein L484_026098 [Morus notabilis]|uniref:Uncharacterized protein n=1 Tax=Morus notabilis TaxID=981085 RepID=W9R837_9ROSA|nr:hypothetical protein L484_026098 [Morus notabilis]
MARSTTQYSSNSHHLSFHSRGSLDITSAGNKRYTCAVTSSTSNCSRIVPKGSIIDVQFDNTL